MKVFGNIWEEGGDQWDEGGEVGWGWGDKGR
jgi:hypothetical protein